MKVNPLTVTASPVCNALNETVEVELAVAPELKTLVGAEKPPEFNFNEKAAPPLMLESKALKPPVRSLPEILRCAVAKELTVIAWVPAGVLGPVVTLNAVGSLTRVLMTLKSL